MRPQAAGRAALLRSRADFRLLVAASRCTLPRNRCSSSLSIGRGQRVSLLGAVVTESCPEHFGTDGSSLQEHPAGYHDPAGLPGTVPSKDRESDPWLSRSRCLDRARRRCCKMGGLAALPMVSNFAAFSHAMGWLLRSGAVADIALVLPEEPSQDERDAEQGEGEHLREHERPGSLEPVPGSGVHRRGGSRGGGARHEQGGGSGEEALGQRTQWEQSAGRGGRGSQDRRFLAHSVVLAARSEKFAAMLRFLRMQDTGGSLDSEDEEDSEADQDDASANTSCAHAPTAEEREGSCNHQPSGDDYQSLDGTSSASQAGIGSSRWCRGHEQGAGSGLPRSEPPRPDDAPRSRDGQAGGVRGWRGHRCRPRRRALREVELKSPLLSARSLGLFLDFLYTGLLDPSTSPGELAELALIADEYLVPELTEQAEMLLVETLVS